MPKLEITLDRRDLARFRTLLKANRTMAAKSLTQVAYAARDDWRRLFPTMFHLRRRWLITGARVDMATPSTLTARVKNIDKFFGRHTEGVDTPKRAADGRLFVPNEPVVEQGTHTRIRSRLRQMERTKRKPFEAGGMLLRRETKKSTPLRVLGYLRKDVDIEPRFDALGVTEQAVRKNYGRLYERMLVRWARTGKA